MISICDNSQCTGCALCENVCPKKAIKMIYNKEGFIYPNIDNEECIDCGICKRKCPVNNSLDYNFPVYAYKGKSLNDDLLYDSTSGAIFSELAEEIFQDKGVVVGAFLDECYLVKHVFIERSSDLYKIRGSKYIGSNLSGVYINIKKRLENNQRVLFSGTPCQIAALNSYIDDELKKLLVTVDFICHGVGSQIIFEKFIHQCEEKYNSRITNIKFRSKIHGYLHSSMMISFDNGKKFIKPSYKNGFGYPFSCGMINRLSCSNCKYACLGRQSDITLSDCINNLSKSEKKKGCSYVLVNSPKGKMLLQKCNLDLIEISIETVAKAQMHLNSPQRAHKNRNSIMNDIDKSYNHLYKLYLKPPKKNILKALKERFKYAKSQWFKS